MLTKQTVRKLILTAAAGLTLLSAGISNAGLFDPEPTTYNIKVVSDFSAVESKCQFGGAKQAFLLEFYSLDNKRCDQMIMPLNNPTRFDDTFSAGLGQDCKSLSRVEVTYLWNEFFFKAPEKWVFKFKAPTPGAKVGQITISYNTPPLCSKSIVTTKGVIDYSAVQPGL